MRVNFGTIVNDARGSIDGITYSKNKSGAYVRGKVTPSNPQTPYQQAARALLSNFSKAWADLTDAQRVGWTEFAKQFGMTDVFGAKKPINGLSAFIRVNTQLSNAGAATLNDSPVDNVVTDLATVAPVLDASDQKLFITGTPDPLPADHLLYVSVTPSVSSGREFVKNLFRFVEAKALAAPTEIVWPGSRFGSLVAGQKHFVNIQVINTANGAITTGLTTRLIVVA